MKQTTDNPMIARLETMVRARPWIDAVFLVGCLVIAIGLSWGRLLDPVIDVGRELYVAWRLTEGDVLYRDLDYFNGPLSPWFNALWLQVAGANLRALFILNSLVAAGALLLSWQLVRRLASRPVALLGGLSFICLFAVVQLEPIGNSNWIAPYSHEMPHGILLALLGLWLLSRAVAVVCAGRAGYWPAISDQRRDPSGVSGKFIYSLLYPNK